ncbi:hypothetical protein C5S29_01345 [ANME-1 cluster archaeon GoMg3.2]|nr:hypothetical protein [ANME-1 cluster archaeon GoMg3.2]
MSFKINTARALCLLNKSNIVLIVDYKRMEQFMLNYGLKPSEALHVLTMSKTKTSYILSEDGEFDNVEWIERIWPGKEEL